MRDMKPGSLTRVRAHLMYLLTRRFDPFYALQRVGRLTIGRHTYGRLEIEDYDGAGIVQVGNFSSIGRNVTVILGGSHALDALSTYPFHRLKWTQKPIEPKSYVHIGSDVWIGHGVTIRSNVTIGDGAVIGAGSMVVRDIEPYAIAVGAPARVVRHRFEAAERELLLREPWWLLPDEALQRSVERLAAPVASSADIADAVELLRVENN